jgi:hypothetical protein
MVCAGREVSRVGRKLKEKKKSRRKKVEKGQGVNLSSF